MITQVQGNLVTYPLDAFIHQANCFCTMNSGVAKTVRLTYPEVYEADCKTKKGDKSKMGTFSFAKTRDGKFGFNLYSQYDFGYDGKCRTDYLAIKNGLTKILTHVLENCPPNAKIGIPCKMGCVRGGGDWNEVMRIINEVFTEMPVQVFIVEFNEYSTKDDDSLSKLRKAYKKHDLMGEVIEEE